MKPPALWHKCTPSATVPRLTPAALPTRLVPVLPQNLGPDSGGFICIGQVVRDHLAGLRRVQGGGGWGRLRMTHQGSRVGLYHGDMLESEVRKNEWENTSGGRQFLHILEVIV